MAVVEEVGAGAPGAGEPADVTTQAPAASESEPSSATPAAPKGPSGGTIWLSTPHWLLMTVTPGYAPLYARLHQRCNDHFVPAMHIEPAMTEASYWEPILANQQHANHEGTGLYLAGFHKAAKTPEIGCVISFSGIVHDEFQACWLGYRLDSALERLGLMYAAVAPAVDSVFEKYKLHRIMASHQPENLRSGRLLRKLGFGIEGYARDFMNINGRWHDNVLLARLAPGC